MLEVAQFPIRLTMVPERRSTSLDGAGQNIDDSCVQFHRPPALYGPSLAAGRNPRLVEDLTNIDVAQPGDGTLVQKGRLNWRRSAPQPFG